LGSAVWPDGRKNKIKQRRNNKNMKKLAIIVGAVALMAFGRSAQAQILEGTSTAPLNITSGGSGVAGSVTSWVYSDSAVDSQGYIFVYQLTVGTGVPDDLGSSIALSFYGSSIVGTPTAASSVSFLATQPGTTPTTAVTFNDTFGGVVNYNLDGISPNDTTYYLIVDTSATGITSGTADLQEGYQTAGAILTPVPEASTITAGALMLLPLGIGAVRALRKERIA
jgi:hypothetical protein